MKKVVLLFAVTFLIVALGFISCKHKTSIEEINNGLNNENTFKNVVINPFEGINQEFDLWFSDNYLRLESVTREEIVSFDEEVQVMIFNVIPAERKASVWREKYDELLALDIYNSEQRAFIRSLRGKATTALYSNYEVAEAQLVFFNSRRQFGSDLFNDDELRSIMISLDNIEMAIGGGSFCKCSNDSDWCGSPIDAGDCSGACDHGSSSGCGTLWSYPCDGRCRFNVSPPIRH